MADALTGWQAVLDQQLDLHRYWRSPEGRRFAYGFGESIIRIEQEVGGFGDGNFTTARNIAEIEAMKLYSADPFYVDPDMMTLVETATETFQPEPFAPSDLLTAFGFVVLPRPMFMLDRHGKRVSFRAFGWSPVMFQGFDEESEAKVAALPHGIFGESGVHLSLYSHVDDMFGGVDDYVPGREQEEEFWRKGPQLVLAHITSWAFGTDIPRGGEGERTAGWWRPIQAFLRLTLQTIGDRYRQQPPRAARRRAARELKEKEDYYITVIRLRRPRGRPAENGQPVDWSHRWIVGGHWRNQWYPSLGLHRQIYIHDFVKGPEDKPLLVRRGRAFEFVR